VAVLVEHTAIVEEFGNVAVAHAAVMAQG